MSGSDWDPSEEWLWSTWLADLVVSGKHVEWCLVEASHFRSQSCNLKNKQSFSWFSLFTNEVHKFISLLQMITNRRKRVFTNSLEFSFTREIAKKIKLGNFTTRLKKSNSTYQEPHTTFRFLKQSSKDCTFSSGFFSEARLSSAVFEFEDIHFSLHFLITS